MQVADNRGVRFGGDGRNFCSHPWLRQVRPSEDGRYVTAAHLAMADMAIRSGGLLLGLVWRRGWLGIGRRLS